MMTAEEKDKNVITFNNGLPGFESLKTFVLEDIEGSEPFKNLKSTEDENIGFVTIVPFDFKVDYEVKLTEAVINSLKIEAPEDVLILNTVTLNSDAKKITTNLKAPIIINSKNNLGYQMILDRENYSIKHPLIKE
ncbi:flagellar assembly protein FliW [Clostridium sulfidigenes]|uniref:Flagellar assembly factor FliW n=1 Tax=Clostridium sulfidigenes TaxID=318464 RepID=A0A084JIL2_9CLOT|nr:flagellar assembly protein FliW [Clostridium sulfidigenes]KEZ88796.1 flagellar assembly protein FliW [Clostridium sulfidigenes]